MIHTEQTIEHITPGTDEQLELYSPPEIYGNLGKLTVEQMSLKPDQIVIPKLPIRPDAFEESVVRPVANKVAIADQHRTVEQLVDIFKSPVRSYARRTGLTYEKAVENIGPALVKIAVKDENTHLLVLDEWKRLAAPQKKIVTESTSETVQAEKFPKKTTQKNCDTTSQPASSKQSNNQPVIGGVRTPKKHTTPNRGSRKPKSPRTHNPRAVARKAHKQGMRPSMASSGRKQQKRTGSGGDRFKT